MILVYRGVFVLRLKEPAFNKLGRAGYGTMEHNIVQDCKDHGVAQRILAECAKIIDAKDIYRLGCGKPPRVTSQMKQSLLIFSLTFVAVCNTIYLEFLELERWGEGGFARLDKDSELSAHRRCLKVKRVVTVTIIPSNSLSPRRKIRLGD